jgi:hypothetical protein
MGPPKNMSAISVTNKIVEDWQTMKIKEKNNISIQTKYKIFGFSG